MELGPSDDRLGHEPGSATLLRVGVVTGPGPRQLCLFRVLTADGARVRLSGPRGVGAWIEILLPTGQGRIARIAWVEDGEALLFFEEPGADDARRRRMARVELDQLAMVRHGTEISFVTARDIGPSGANLECERPLGEGQKIIFTLEGLGAMRAVVRWEQDGRCGIGFDRPLAVTDLAGWLDRQSERRA